MTRRDAILVAVVLAELTAGGWLVGTRLLAPRPPVPDWAVLDAGSAAALRGQADRCRSAADWRQLGEAYLACGFYPEAERCYRTAAAAAPAEADHVFAWAFALERLGRLAEANEQYRRAVALGHRRPADCWYFSGRNYLRLGEEGQAAATFRAAGDLPAARYELARLDARAGRVSDAAAAAERLTAAFPRAVQPALLQYRIALLRDDRAAVDHAGDRVAHARGRMPNPFDGEAERVRRAREPFTLNPRWRQAEEWIGKGMLDRAETALTEGLQLQWEAAGVDLLAEVAYQRGRHDEAVRLLEEIVDREGPAVHSLERLGDTYAATGRADEARQAWERAARLGSLTEGKDLFYKLALLDEKRGATEAARRHQARASLAAGVEAYDRGDLTNAPMWLEKAAELVPDTATTWFYLGEVYRGQGRRDAAQSAYRRCLDLDPGHGRAAAALAR